MKAIEQCFPMVLFIMLYKVDVALRLWMKSFISVTIQMKAIKLYFPVVKIGFHKEFALIQQCFCAVYDYVEKEDLSKGYQNPKRKLGATTHFSEIIEPKIGKKLPNILCISTLF